MSRIREPSRLARHLLAAAGLGALAVAAAAAPLGIVLDRLTVGANSYGDSSPSWSPDGTCIAYDSRDADPYYPTIYYKEIAGGPETQLTGQGEIAPDYVNPAYSPDGNWVAYAKADGTWYHLYLRPAKGGAETPITTGAAGPDYAPGLFGDVQPCWSADGQWIAFGSSRGDPDLGMFEIWVVRPDGSGLRQVTTGGVNDTGWPSWSPDGGRIVYSQNDEVWEVAQGAPGSWGIPQLLWDGGNRPCFSPSGNHIAYDAGGDIFVRAYPAGEANAVTSGPDADTGPCWSPDGKSLAFSSDREDGHRAIWVARGVDAVPTVPVTLGRVKALYR